ncbi:MAG: protein kinase [Myxococcota bacterium]|nr:protein kinase [Myxococcota bacterium]
MIGAQIGQLTIKRKLGEGGMGAVYYAEHQVLRTPRVIKVLLPQWTQNAMIVQRFVNEARAAASIKHRNIIEVHDCGQLPDGSWFIVMDYLEGGTLAAFCASQGGPLSMHAALQIIAPVANGLEAAHAANIVHRDLKPDNIFLVQHETNPHHPIILDFGIAKLGEADGGAVTRTGMMAGTPAYMAPEQMRDLKIVDKRSDVYALGVVAYQMITGGWLPYASKNAPHEYNDLSAAEIYHRQMSQPAVDPRHRFDGVSDRWANAILAALHPDPARRPQTARAFALLLAEATPGDAFEAAGTDIVRTYAHELLEIGNLLETVRSPTPKVKVPTGRYQLGDRLGVGGMAEVFRGTVIGAEGFVRPVAVKKVLPGFSTVPQFASMFVQEAQIASQLSHPNIVSVLDFDRDPDGRLFLVMEYVEGRDLSSLAETGLLPFSTLNFVMSEALRGLGYAHELPTAGSIRGVVHRDVSPHNVLLSWEGAVKLSDFGIAKAREASNATASTMLKGKPSYMSPEQANGEQLDGRSDLFAVGVMLWEALTGRRLFDGNTQEIIAQVLFRPIPRPSSLRAGVPADLESITMRLLERDRSARYANAELAVDDLARCADAPRNGRSELARLLAERFPQAVAGRASRQQIQPPSGSNGTRSAPTAQDRRPPAVATPVMPAQTPATPWQPSSTTLASAASQSVAPRRVAARRPWIAGIGAVVVVGMSLGAFLAFRKGDERQPVSAAPSIDAAAPVVLGEIRIATVPTGATVKVDGHSRGPSPITLQFTPGTRIAIMAENDGYMPASQTITVGEGTQELSLTLPPTPVAIGIDAGVLDAGNVTSVADTPPTNRTKKPPKDSRTKSSGSAGTKGSGSYNPNDVVGD